MHIKTNTVKLLIEAGIRQKHARIIRGQLCKPTGRKGASWLQVEFDGALIEWKEPFVYCVPLAALSNDQAETRRGERKSE